jgi:hypothetical protein
MANAAIWAHGAVEAGRISRDATATKSTQPRFDLAMRFERIEGASDCGLLVVSEGIASSIKRLLHKRPRVIEMVKVEAIRPSIRRRAVVAVPNGARPRAARTERGREAAPGRQQHTHRHTHTHTQTHTDTDTHTPTHTHTHTHFLCVASRALSLPAVPSHCLSYSRRWPPGRAVVCSASSEPARHAACIADHASSCVTSPPACIPICHIHDLTIIWQDLLRSIPTPGLPLSFTTYSRHRWAAWVGSGQAL